MRSSVRVCHVVPWFGIKIGGGTAEFIAKICRSQAAEKIRPVVLSGTYGYEPDLAASLSETQCIVVKSYLDRAGFSLMPTLPYVCHEQLGGMDIVHLHAFRTFQNLIMYIFCRRLDIPFVVDVHGSAPYGTRKVMLKKFYDWLVGKQMLRNSACLVAESEVGIREYLDIVPDLAREKLQVVPPSFDVSEFENFPPLGEFRSEHGIDAEEKLVVFVGRLAKIKGLEFLIECFAALQKSRADTRLALVGDDAGTGYKSILEDLATELGVANKIIFTGYKGGKDKFAIVRDADVLVQTSIQEQGPRVPFEAILCGTSVLVSSDTGCGEVVAKYDAGETVPYGDKQALVGRLLWMFEHPVETNRRTITAREKIVSDMSMQAVAVRYTQIYTTAMS